MCPDGTLVLTETGVCVSENGARWRNMKFKKEARECLQE